MPPSKRKFHRTVYQYELLTEEEPGPLTLEGIHYLAIEGHGSGMFLGATGEVVDGPQMAKLLISQGSDPEFFELDEHGDDAEE